jgi:hypothetical protein
MSGIAGDPVENLTFAPVETSSVEYPDDAIIVHESRINAYVSGSTLDVFSLGRDANAGDVLRFTDLVMPLEEMQYSNIVNPATAREAFVLGASALDIYWKRQVGEGVIERPVAQGVPVEPVMRDNVFSGMTIILEGEDEEENLKTASRLAIGVNTGMFAIRPSGVAQPPITNRLCIGEVCYDRFGFDTLAMPQINEIPRAASEEILQ